MWIPYRYTLFVSSFLLLQVHDASSECDIEALRCDIICFYPELAHHCNTCGIRRPMRFGKRSLAGVENDISIQPRLKMKGDLDKVLNSYYPTKRLKENQLIRLPEVAKGDSTAVEIAGRSHDSEDWKDLGKFHSKLPKKQFFQNRRGSHLLSKLVSLFPSLKFKENLSCDDQKLNPLLASLSPLCQKTATIKRNLSFLTSKELNSKQLISGIKHIMNTASLPLDPVFYGCYVSPQ